MQGERSKVIKSAERTVRLFELFSTTARPLTVTEIANELAIPQPSASMLVSSFVELGYLEKVPETRAYCTTMRVMLLGTWMHRQFGSASALPDLALKAVRATGASLALAMRNGHYSQNVYAQHGDDPDHVVIESGMNYPLACCAPGWTMLAELSDIEIDKIIRRTQAECPVNHWRNSSKDARAKIEFYREHGYVMSEGHIEPGLSGVAVSLQSSDSPFRMAVSMGGETDRIEKKLDSIVEELHKISDAYAKNYKIIDMPIPQHIKISA